MLPTNHQGNQGEGATMDKVESQKEFMKKMKAARAEFLYAIFDATMPPPQPLGRSTFTYKKQPDQPGPGAGKEPTQAKSEKEQRWTN